jgi:hypothetical protein
VPSLTSAQVEVDETPNWVSVLPEMPAGAWIGLVVFEVLPSPDWP